MKKPNENSVGSDGVPISTIKKNIKIFIPVLLEIFDMSTSSDCFPLKIKTALIVLVYKANDQMILMNTYRPISYFSNTFAKLLEM